MREQIDVAVIGGGQAGLVMSWHLRALGIEHLILERSRVAERWRTQRWHSLRFQFPNYSLELPGQRYEGGAPDAFAGRDEVVDFIERYAQRIAAPIRCGVDVLALRRDDASGLFLLDTNEAVLEARRVVIATGPFQRPAIPPLAAGLPRHVLQVDAGSYASPAQLPAGAVLVIGSGSSGVQIAEELHQAGRRVYLCVGRHRRAPRRYRGQDLLWWMMKLGRFDKPIHEMPGGRIPPPTPLTGADGGHDVNLRQFACDGVALLGHLQGAAGDSLAFADDLEQSLTEADESYRQFLLEADAIGAESDLERPGGEQGVEPPPCVPVTTPSRLSLKTAGINSIVWCTGYIFDFAWAHLPIFGPDGVPLQRRGVTECPGAYFLGLHFMHNMKSGVLFGVKEDAEYLAERIRNAQ